MERKIYWVTEDRLSEILEVSTRHVRTICKQARNKEKGDEFKGYYDFVLGVQLYVKEIKTEKGDLQTDIKKIEKQHKQLKLDMAKGLTVTTKQVEDLLGDMLIKFKSKLSSIPGRISLLLLNKNNSSEIEKILKSEFDAVQNELVEIEFEKIEEENE